MAYNVCPILVQKMVHSGGGENNMSYIPSLRDMTPSALIVLDITNNDATVDNIELLKSRSACEDTEASG